MYRWSELILAAIAAHPEVAERVRWAPPEPLTGGRRGQFVVCDTGTNVWQWVHDVRVEQLLSDLLRELPGLSEKERRYVDCRKGRVTMARVLACHVEDERFLQGGVVGDRARDVFAVANGCFGVEGDGNGLAFRALRLDDFTTVATDWAYSRDRGVGDASRPELEGFIAKVLPVVEERHAALAFFASLMHVHAGEQKVLLLTGQRGGSEGKTALVALMCRFFGEHAAHAFGVPREAAFRGKRLVVVEEPDARELKRLAGLCVTGTPALQAGVVVTAAERQDPSRAFGGRQNIVEVPMRARFVVDASDATGPWTYEAERGVSERFGGWMPALAEVLQHFISGARDSGG